MNNKKAFVARGHGLLNSSYLVLGNAIKKMYSEETSVKGNEMILDLSSFELSYVALNSANCNISRKKKSTKISHHKKLFLLDFDQDANLVHSQNLFKNKNSTVYFF